MTDTLLEGPEKAEKTTESMIAQVANNFGVHSLRQLKDILMMRVRSQKLGSNVSRQIARATGNMRQKLGNHHWAFAQSDRAFKSRFGQSRLGQSILNSRFFLNRISGRLNRQINNNLLSPTSYPLKISLVVAFLGGFPQALVLVAQLAFWVAQAVIKARVVAVMNDWRKQVEITFPIWRYHPPVRNGKVLWAAQHTWLDAPRTI